MAFKHRTDEELERIAAYYGRRRNIMNTVVLILNATIFLFNLLIFLGCCAYELPYNGGIPLVLTLVFTAYASYQHGEQRYPPMT